MVIKNSVLSIILFTSLFSFQTKPPAEKVKPILKAEMVGWEKEDNSDYLRIKTSLTNTSEKDSLIYLSMTCSWNHAFAVGSNDFIIKSNNCDKNLPVYVKLGPGGTDVKIIDLEALKTIDQMHNIKIRIGYHLVNRNDIRGSFSVVDKFQDMSNVIWSDTLVVK